MQNSPLSHNSYIRKRDSNQVNLRDVALKSSGKAPSKHAQTSPASATRTQKNKTSSLTFAFRYVFTSALIFCATTVAMNFTAYSAIFYQHYLEFTGQTKNISLLEYSNDDQLNQKVAEHDQLQEIQTEQIKLSQKLNLPIFNADIIPPGTRIIIPRMGTNVPVKDVPDNNLFAQNWNGLESDIQKALLDGVVHYPGTPTPNQSGNVVFTGHSSYYPWNPGRYKDVFAVLHNVVLGDEIIVFHKQKKYAYQVTQIEKIYPEDVQVLGDAGDDRLTLITCTPIGTNIKRLVVTAKPLNQISSQATNTALLSN